jgi:hypothetical protein
LRIRRWRLKGGKLYGTQWRTLAKQSIKKQIQNSHSFSGEEFREGTSGMLERREREREREQWFGDHESPHRQIPGLLRKAMRNVWEMCEKLSFSRWALHESLVKFQRRLQIVIYLSNGLLFRNFFACGQAKKWQSSIGTSRESGNHP